MIAIMDSKNDHYNILLRALLPGDLFDYFEIVQVIVNEKTLDVHLDELDVKPEEYRHEKLSSKGFHKIAVIQDFPIRERAFYLHVRRRRWQVEGSGKIVSRNWDAVAKGTRFTQGFASFLKELFGQVPGK